MAGSLSCRSRARKERYSELREGFRRLSQHEPHPVSYYFQYILAREWGRHRCQEGRSRTQAYANLPPGVIIVRSGTDDDTRHRMKRKLRNIVCADDKTSKRLAKRISSTLPKQRISSTLAAQVTAQQSVLSWALGRRLDPYFFEQAMGHLQLYAGTLESARECIEKVKLAAGEAFLRRERTLGIPGVHLSVIQWVGPSSSLHLHERSRELYEEAFEENVSEPWIALVASLLSPSSLLHNMSGPMPFLSIVLAKMRSIDGFGYFNGCDLVQDIVGHSGPFFEKPSDMFTDQDIASYARPEAGCGCNFIFRDDLHTHPHVPDQERQWVLEQRHLLRKWKEWGMSEFKVGSRRRQLDLFMIEFSLCDYQRAVG